MRTQVMHEPAVGQPWLEHYPADGGPPERTVLESFPFTIGRNEATDLPVNSSRVSREHAVIFREEDDYRVRDLGSTNGTFLNGQRIEEAPLADGDILLVADVELTFFCGRSRFPCGAATQVMELSPQDLPGEAPAVEMLRQVRTLQETLLHRAMESLFQPVAELADGRIAGYEALSTNGQTGCGPDAPGALAIDCRLAARVRHLGRLVAVEQSAALPGRLSIFVALDTSEIGAEGLADALGRLRGATGTGHRLVVEIPEGAASDLPYACRFREQLHELEIGIAYGGFAAGQLELIRRSDVRPDFLKLAPSLVAGIDGHAQRRQQAESIVHAGRELGCDVVAVGVQSREEAETCAKLGCRFGQGDLFGSPAPIHSWLADGRGAGP
jgi:EAL domain-containing protein (putative c-di-GMP-specific phosphodiesterase class I)